MATIFLILTVIMTVFVVIFGQYNQTDLSLHLMYSDISFKMSFLAVTVIIYALGVVGGVMLMIKALFESNLQYSRIKKRLEKTSIGADDSDLRVKTLENKIKTLEVALEKTLGSKTEDTKED